MFISKDEDRLGIHWLAGQGSTWKEKELFNQKMKINGYKSHVSAFRMEIITLRADRFWNNLTITTAGKKKTCLHKKGLCGPVMVLAGE